jgi:pimeloyl-ACP methyl ester carboxylesterase
VADGRSSATLRGVSDSIAPFVSTLSLSWGELAYETFGERTRPLVLLVPGHEGQCVWWPDGLCQALVGRGLCVARFDNRDAGLSSRIDAPRPDLAAIVGGCLASCPYTLEDLADDAFRLLDALGAFSAHVVGHAMGGIVAQLLAIRHPERVASLVVISAGPGKGIHGPFDPARVPALFALPTERAAHIEARVLRGKGTLSKGLGAEQAQLVEVLTRVYDRGHGRGNYLEEELRKIAALLSATDRRAQLAHLSVPVTVIHGDADPLSPIDEGRALAAAVPGARFVEVAGLGHDLPPGLWPLIVDTLAPAR